MDKLKFLESVLGQGQKTNRDYYQFHCPFCNHYKLKLGVSLGTGRWKCWVCGVSGTKVGFLIRKLNLDYDTIKRASAVFSEVLVDGKHEEHTPPITLPKEYIPLWKVGSDIFYKKALSYLVYRGITHLDLFKHRIGYCVTGKYKDMIIFPFYDENGDLIYFTARSYSNNSSYKFSTPIGVSKDQVFDGDIINWGEPIIIVESKIDAIVVRRNAIPLNGKQISKSLFKRILDEKVKTVYLCLDGDAVKDIMKYSSWFNEHGISVYTTEFPIDEISTKKEGKIVYHDPASLGYERVWGYINKAKKVTETDSFRYGFIKKLQKLN